MTLHEYLKLHVPKYLWDDLESISVPEGSENLTPTFQELFQFGRRSRDEEVTKLEAQIEGLRLALNDKFTLNQTSKTFTLWRKK